jgi:hypothetical protein
MRGFPELLNIAARFHSEIATAFFLRDIVTTNWDTLFEEYASATPFVVPDDYASWGLGERKVFKLHGSIHNLSTIVATERDYARCYRRLRGGTIGATFKHMLATRSVVFVGYSFGDSDLNRLLTFVKREMGDMLPRSYLVTPHGYEGSDFPEDRVIVTDGTYFIRRLKEAVVDLQLMRPDSIYAQTEALLRRVNRANQRVAKAFDVKRAPNVIYTLAYQNGLQHAFNRILSLQSSGHYSDPHSTRHVLGTYDQLRRRAISDGKYFDAAYIDGYLNGLLCLELDSDDLKDLPLFFVWRSAVDLVDYSDFVTEIAKAETLHKAATRHAQRLVSDLTPGLVVRHKPFLDVTLD